jgi:hypothetical protein
MLLNCIHPFMLIIMMLMLNIDNSVVENWVSLTSKLTAYTYFLLNLPSSARRQLIAYTK